MPTVAEIIDAYTAELVLRVQAGGLAPSSHANTAYYLRQFAEQFGPQEAEVGRQPDLTKFLLHHPSWKTDATKVDAATAVVSCFRWAESMELISKCRYRCPPGLVPKPREPISDADFKAIMHAARGMRSGCRLRLGLYFIRWTGCRTCEMRALTFEMIDWENGVAILPVELNKTRRVGEARIFGLCDRVLRLLRSLRRRRASGQRVFVNGRGRAWTKDSFARLFRKAAVRAGISAAAKAYCLRHSWTVAGIERGLSDRQLADQLGHKGTKLIAWYGRKSRERLEHMRAVARCAARRAAG